MIAKILLGLRKFRIHSENFAILVKLGNFARLAKFRYVAKITVPSKILHFRYLSNFSLSLKFFSRLAKFTVHSENFHFRYLCIISLG